MTLKELYHRNTDIRDSEIPDEWKDSFNEFMYGQGCLMDPETNELIYFYSDFMIWYHENKKAIERNNKIDDIIKD